MSGYIVEKFWHLGSYQYVFYRFVLERYCQQRFMNTCLMIDAGCGPNVSSLSHIPRSIFVVGIDVDRRNVAESHRKAKDRGFKNFSYILASIASLPFRLKTFDLAVCVDVLEHIKTKQEGMNEISRVCKHKASFIGSTSNLMNPVMLFDSLMPECATRVFTKVEEVGYYARRGSRFSFARLMQTLKRASFEVRDIKLLGFPFFRAALYEFSSRKLPWYTYLWMTFDILTKKKPLIFLKETMVFQATKNG